MKQFILKILFKLGILGRVHLGIRIVNFIFQNILLINKKMQIPIHFTSRINTPHNITFRHDNNTLASFAVSGCCYIQAYNGIQLGNNVLFSKGLNLISANHTADKSESWDTSEPIVIGDNVWIGVNVTILPGVKIGNNCIVGAGSVVTKSFIEDNLIIAGNPAKKIKKKIYEKNSINSTK